MGVEEVEYLLYFLDLVVGNSGSFVFGVAEGRAGEAGVALLHVGASHFSHMILIYLINISWFISVKRKTPGSPPRLLCFPLSVVVADRLVGPPTRAPAPITAGSIERAVILLLEIVKDSLLLEGLAFPLVVVVFDPVKAGRKQGFCFIFGVFDWVSLCFRATLGLLIESRLLGLVQAIQGVFDLEGFRVAVSRSRLPQYSDFSGFLIPGYHFGEIEHTKVLLIGLVSLRQEVELLI